MRRESHRSVSSHANRSKAGEAVTLLVDVALRRSVVRSDQNVTTIHEWFVLFECQKDCHQPQVVDVHGPEQSVLHSLSRHALLDGTPSQRLMASVVMTL